MAKKYGRNPPKRQKNSVLGRYILIPICLSVGYFGASFYDLAHLQSWVSQQLASYHVGSAPKITPKPQAQLPKPNFEFYTLLTKEPEHRLSQLASVPVVTAHAKNPVANAKMGVTAPSTSEPKQPALAAAIVGKENYSVQVASFKNRSEAERMKASLVLKGFDVTVVGVSQQQVNWFRVMIGPFATKTQAQQAQTAFAAREHVVGMIRRMDA